MSLGPGAIVVTISLPSISSRVLPLTWSFRVLFQRQLPASQLSGPLPGSVDDREPPGARRFYQLLDVFKSHPALLAT
jgi:hypothetical protein